MGTMKKDNKWDILSKGMEEYASFLEMEDEHLDAKKAKQKPGGSNAGKYKTKGPFCGPSGGAPKGTYPVNTRKRAVAALAYARHAPRPAGIKRCVCRHWSSLPACKKDSSDEMVSTIDELRTMYADGMLSKEGVFIEVMDISNILNMGPDEVASIVGEIFGKDNPEGALEMISVLMNESKDR
jgi:hypothetical protein